MKVGYHPREGKHSAIWVRAAGWAYVVSVLNIALDKVLLEMIGIKHESGSCILNCFVPHGDITELFG